ncbi:hypothetical protein HPB48_026985 [Haemaphysalis longicornis]|uniref:Uncharacterized protein n=1 Tax=Haemaphysalis longicornis TaxID=44386 RepID=A0A9J6HCU7_HAELO|nr:hypothetical protein HPB48_026985 [Haemaphysalis longicornis]
MRKVTNAHLEPYSFDKIKVDIAFQLFRDQVIKALFIYREHIRSSYETVQPTEDFVKEMIRLIRVITSRTSQTALKPGSPNVRFLERFLEYLQESEQHAKKKNCGRWWFSGRKHSCWSKGYHPEHTGLAVLSDVDFRLQVSFNIQIEPG